VSDSQPLKCGRYERILMKRIFQIVQASSIAAWIGIGAAANASTTDHAVGLSPTHVRPPQVSTCVLVGKSFGTLEAGGFIRFRDRNYPVDTSQGSADEIQYVGPNVKATFHSAHGRHVGEGENGEPTGMAGDVAGTLSIEVAGRIFTVPASEHCIIFE